MPPSTWLPLLLLASLATAADPLPFPVPPSPSTAPGKRFVDPPQLTHWPAIAYADEDRHVAFMLPYRDGMPADAYAGPIPAASSTGSIGWDGAKALPFTLPAGSESISGLLPLRADQESLRTAVLTWATGEVRLPLRVVDARSPWPVAGMRNGFPVDARGIPVVLFDQRRDAARERKWRLLAGAGQRRPDGSALLVGDPLAGLGADSWEGLAAARAQAQDLRYPQHAALVALAPHLADAERVPRTIVWCPGNGVLAANAWTAEETRLLGVVASRLAALEVRPRLVLALPPWPVEEAQRARARERREALQAGADSLGWEVADLAAAAGDPLEANKVGDGVYTTYPIGEARERVRAMLRRAAE